VIPYISPEMVEALMVKRGSDETNPPSADENILLHQDSGSGSPPSPISLGLGPSKPLVIIIGLIVRRLILRFWL
jgi:hypothetical protein